MCTWHRQSPTYLGHKIDEEGQHPITELVKAINAGQSPQNVHQLKAYLGLLNYYGRFIPIFATRLAPLYKLLKANQQWKWTKTEATAFQNSKELVTSSQLLVHFNSHKKLIL